MSQGLSFSEFMDGALYHPEWGFYETGGQAGRRGDFVTSPEVGPLFGACLARAVDRWWEDLGRPAPFLVDEHGAGPGTLARTALVAAPACAPALRWTLVERSNAQRALHRAHLPHIGDLDGGERSPDGRWQASAGGPLVASTAHRPDRRAHVVLANELLDNLPFDLIERTAEGWHEIRVAAVGTSEGGPGRSSESPSGTAARSTPHAAPTTSPLLGAGHEAYATPSPSDPCAAPPAGGPGPHDRDRPSARTRRATDRRSPAVTPTFVEVSVVADPVDSATARVLAPSAPTGSRIPLQREAGEWVADSLAQLAPGGRLLVLDYATTTAGLARRAPSEWIRTYAGHARGGDPLDTPGSQDITVEVCTDQLAAAARPPDLDRDQASALRAWGLDDLVDEGRRLWAEAAASPDLAALRARSRITEAEALTDPAGLGAFRVLEWRASAPYSGQPI